MICFKCGNKNDNKALFCIGCGYRFANTDAVDLPFGETGPLKSDSEYIQRFREAVAERYTIDREIGREGWRLFFLQKTSVLKEKWL